MHVSVVHFGFIVSLFVWYELFIYNSFTVNFCIKHFWDILQQYALDSHIFLDGSKKERQPVLTLGLAIHLWWPFYRQSERLFTEVFSRTIPFGVAAYVIRCIGWTLTSVKEGWHNLSSECCWKKERIQRKSWSLLSLTLPTFHPYTLFIHCLSFILFQATFAFQYSNASNFD